MQLTILDTLDELRRRSDAWDDLWIRSDVALPSARAALVAQWIDQFAPAGRFRGLLVEDQGRLVGGLALIGQRVGPWFEVGTLPSNDWSACGELLIDREADATAVAARLAEGLCGLPWPLLWLRLTRRDAAAWRALSQQCVSARLKLHQHDQYEIGVVELPHDFASYEAHWSGNHRRHMGKARRRLDRDGGAELQVYSSLTPDEVEPLLDVGFEIENRSWKGSEGTSVLQSPGLREFYVRQARQLAAWGQLRLVFLAHRGRPIAFEYGWWAKNRYFTPKVAFDPEFAQYTPSQVLRYRLFERLAAEPAPPTVDFLGPLSDATSRWITGRYTIGTTLLAVQPLMGRAMLQTYRLLRAARQRTRRPQVAAPAAAPLPASAAGVVESVADATA